MERGLEERAAELIEKVRIAAKASVQPLPKTQRPLLSTAASNTSYSSTEKIVVIGASTGGVEALKEVITVLPANSPAILVAQHMPANFTKTFAERLNGLSAVAVSEAVHGERVLPGHVYIAPGNYHLLLAKSGANYVCHLSDEAKVSGHRPSVDALFRSAAEVAGGNCVSVILTGMGKDGAMGMLALRNKGATTIGQDEASSVVYGMPKAAYELGAVEHQLTLTKVSEKILKCCAARGGGHIRV